jgi:hypothetical protein
MWLIAKKKKEANGGRHQHIDRQQGDRYWTSWQVEVERDRDHMRTLAAGRGLCEEIILRNEPQSFRPAECPMAGTA